MSLIYNNYSIIYQTGMSKNKVKILQPSLQPWNHEQQPNTSLTLQNGSMPISVPMNPQFQFNQQFQNYKKTDGTVSKDNNEAEHRKKDKQSRKSYSIDYVKRNQQNLHLYNYMQNYAIVLNQDSQKFTPINGNNSNHHNFIQTSILKRPFINTTYIGYYQQQPFLVDHHKTKKDTRKNWSSQSKRPKTSDFTILSRTNSKGRMLRQPQIQQNYNQIYERSTLAVSGHHLQKVLKIKQKLRQKLKKNSNKRDIQRGMYVNKTMKIQQQTIQLQKNQSFKRPKSSNKSLKQKSRLIESNNENNKVDKWKQYVKLQNSIKQKQKKLQSIKDKQKQVLSYYSANKKLEMNPFLTVYGGSIYK